MRGTGAATDERQRIILIIPGLTGDLLIYKTALALVGYLRKPTSSTRNFVNDIPAFGQDMSTPWISIRFLPKILVNHDQ